MDNNALAMDSNAVTCLCAAKELAPFLHLAVPDNAPKRAKLPDRLFKLMELAEDEFEERPLKDAISIGIDTTPRYDAFSFAVNVGTTINRCKRQERSGYGKISIPKQEFEALIPKFVAKGIADGIHVPYGELNLMIEGDKLGKSHIRVLIKPIPLLRSLIRDVYVIPKVNPEFEAKAREWILDKAYSHEGKGDFEFLDDVVMNVGRDDVAWQSNPRFDAAVTGAYGERGFSWSEYYGMNM